MLKSIIILPDGRELSSGAESENPLMSVSLTESVNKYEELTLGASFASVLDATILTHQDGLELTAGDEVVLYKADDLGVRHKVGVFILEKPVRSGTETIKLTGYDYVIKLDRDLSSWLKGLSGWPYRLIDFAGMVCQACGLELVTTSIPNEDVLVYPLSGEVTGRQLMRWIGEVCCRFCKANADGKMELAWYTPAGVCITPSGDLYYFQNSLSYEEYQVQIIDAVQIRLADSEAGVLWPDVPDGTNSYIIEGNPILMARITDDLLPILQTIKDQLPQEGYRPCKVSIPATLDIRAGDTVQITDKKGVSFTACVMTKVQTGQKDTLECTGSFRRDSSTARNNQTEQEKIAALKSYAAKAQDTADGKRRVFITQPVTPYDAGDLWAQGDSGDLLVCMTARAAGSFQADDWVLATDYINSDTAGSIAQGKVDAQSQLDIFNKLTEDGKMEGLFMQDGQLYINASYIKSGSIVSEGKAFLPPTYDDVMNMLWSVSFPDRFPPKDFYDLNGDGSIDPDDVILAEEAYLGKRDISECPGAYKTDVTVTIEPSNTQAAVLISGTNMWGSEVTLYLGINGSSIPIITGDCSVSGKLAVGEYAILQSLSTEVEQEPKVLSWKDNGDGTYTLIGR